MSIQEFGGMLLELSPEILRNLLISEDALLEQINDAEHVLQLAQQAQQAQQAPFDSIL